MGDARALCKLQIENLRSPNILSRNIVPFTLRKLCSKIRFWPSKARVPFRSNHQTSKMSLPKSTDRGGQKAQASSSHQRTTTSPSTPKSKPHQSPDTRNKCKRSASTVLGSRIEKKQGTKDNGTSPSSSRATTSVTVMRVFINNRLGTRTEIPCSPSDTVGDFKKLAAVYLGTRSQAMILKRQGERPFKDTLTLEDYEVHDGASLDLEVDTCD